MFLNLTYNTTKLSKIKCRRNLEMQTIGKAFDLNRENFWHVLDYLKLFWITMLITSMCNRDTYLTRDIGNQLEYHWSVETPVLTYLPIGNYSESGTQYDQRCLRNKRHDGIGDNIDRPCEDQWIHWLKRRREKPFQGDLKSLWKRP